jgi:glycosyltransferase involved in cell wall biosynthesis
MKGLILCEGFYPEDFLINDLVSEWKKNGYDFDVLTRAPSYPSGKVYKGYKNKIYQQTYFNGVKIHRFPVIQGYQKSVVVKIMNYFSFVIFGSIIALFIGRKYDRIFVYQTGPLTLALPAILIKKIYGATVTIWSQDLWPDTVYAYGFRKTRLLNWFLEGIVKHVYRNCPNILVTCKGFIPKIQQYVNNNAFYWIPNWSSQDYSPKGSVKLPGRFNFTFAGNIGKVQNLKNVVLGFEIFVAEHKDCFLNIIGDGSELQDLIEFVSQKKVKNVNFTGRIAQNEMPDYYHASDVLVISLIDSPVFELTIPAKFQSYLTSSKPLLGVIKGEVKSLIEENEIGFTSSPENIEEIAIAFKKFRTISPEDLENVTFRSKHLLEQSFCRNNLIKKLSNIFWT